MVFSLAVKLAVEMKPEIDGRNSPNLD